MIKVFPKWSLGIQEHIIGCFRTSSRVFWNVSTGNTEIPVGYSRTCRWLLQNVLSGISELGKIRFGTYHNGYPKYFEYVPNHPKYHPESIGIWFLTYYSAKKYPASINNLPGILSVLRRIIYIVPCPTKHEHSCSLGRSSVCY